MIRRFDKEKHNKRRNSRQESNQANKCPAVGMLRDSENHAARTLQNLRPRCILNANDSFVFGIIAEIACFNPNGIRAAGKQFDTSLERGMQGIQLCNVRLKPDPARIQSRVPVGTVGGYKQISGQCNHDRHEGRSYKMRHLHQIE